MIKNIIKKIFGSDNERELSRIGQIIEKTNELEEEYSKKTPEELKQTFLTFKNNFSEDDDLDKIVPEIFALVREASKKNLGLRPYDVQLVGGVVLHEGKIAEMKTGEGKTLVACMPVVLNSIRSKGVHIITVNDYLARRDALWMSPVYKAFDLKVGVLNNDQSYIVELDKEQNEFKLIESKRNEVYKSDVVYGTNSEFGFDYLRDNMKYSLEEVSQRGHSFAIVDEVDSILIDEARTPLIISGPTDSSTIDYKKINEVAKSLLLEDISKDEKTKQVFILDTGTEKIEKNMNLTNLYDPKNLAILHSINQALRALHMYTKDKDYVVQDEKIIIVDEFTGRLMPSRRWSDGLHQAVEVKENVKIEEENQTLASITIQNYFRMYEKLAGMTGTADTEALEFQNIYNLKVVVIPTNAPMIRKDYNDLIYKTEKEKFSAIIEKIVEYHSRGNPVLVGTISVERSEDLSKELRERSIKHQVLNAKNHEFEAEVIAQAGRSGAVTIATNMAGRGTDIVLGGNKDFLIKNKENGSEEDVSNLIQKEKNQILDLDGLVVLGSERHESRRIDNQLRGRAGRQGDPGVSQFFVSMDDDLMRLFGSERISSMMSKLGWKEGEPIEHKMISGSIEGAQKKVETRNYEIRKHLIEYDDVQSQQREVVYGIRNKLLKEEASSEILSNILENIIESLKNSNPDLKEISEEDSHLIANQLGFNLEEKFNTLSELEDIIQKKIENKIESLGELYQPISRFILITTLDMSWKEHLLSMDYLRESVGLRAYGQKNPLREYKKEGFEMFQAMIDGFNFEAVKRFLEVEPVSSEEIDELEKQKNQNDEVKYLDDSSIIDAEEVEQEEPKEEDNTKRNQTRANSEKEKAKRRKLQKQKRQQRKKQRK
ncbi:MAG: preprotein translocase subunit SecA [Thermodesulfobacteriota bacterium]|nr:preprotein translocase subunit SecA [Thermodesulfobacteriota bacterium]